MKIKPPKKIAIINDISGFGRCSMTVALPIVSAMRVQGCPVPTSILSNHLAFPHCHFDDYTDQMPDYLKVWEQLGLSFDGILCGFLGSVDQIRIVENFIASQAAHQPAVIIDPVMGNSRKVLPHDHSRTLCGDEKAGQLSQYHHTEHHRGLSSDRYPLP